MSAVQAHQGSTLFIFGGQWPASIGQLPADVRLSAGDIVIVLHPIASPDAFELVSATHGGAPIPAADIAAGLQSGNLLIDVADRDLTYPFDFSLAFLRGSTEVGHFPADGSLAWGGSGPPTLAVAGAKGVPAASSTAAAVAAASASAAGRTSPTPANSAGTTPAGSAASPAATYPPPTDLTVLAEKCGTLPAGSLPTWLIANRQGNGTDPDPRTGVPTRWVGEGMQADFPAAGPSRPPFSMTAAIWRTGQAAGTGSSPTDRLGSIQLWIYWDGTNLHKGVRTYSGGVWTMAQGADSDPMTIELQASGVAWFWSGLQAGDRYGFVQSGAGGCATTDLSASLAPLDTLK